MTVPEPEFGADGRITKKYSRLLKKYGLRWCAKCRQVLSLDAFKGHAYCIECKRADDRKSQRRFYEVNKDAITEHFKETKSEWVKRFGGCCSRCGYSEFDGGLTFHHVDPLEKAFKPRAGMDLRSARDLETELDKCVLLCWNCHMTLEQGLWRGVFIKNVEVGWSYISD